MSPAVFLPVPQLLYIMMWPVDPKPMFCCTTILYHPQLYLFVPEVGLLFNFASCLDPGLTTFGFQNCWHLNNMTVKAKGAYILFQVNQVTSFKAHFLCFLVGKTGLQMAMILKSQHWLTTHWNVCRHNLIGFCPTSNIHIRNYKMNNKADCGGGGVETDELANQWLHYCKWEFIAGNTPYPKHSLLQEKII